MFRSAAAILTLCLVTVTAQASLVGRAPLTPGGTDYQAYYDDVLNITWLADANLAATNCFGMTPCYPSGGTMIWSTAESWIAAMNTATYLGVSDWRLPTTAQPDGTCSSADRNGQGYGFGCIASEMGHLYHVDGITVSTPGLFSNLKAYNFWSGTRNAFDGSLVWFFNFDSGYQDSHYDTNGYQAWAVAPGDIAAVPVPPAVWLFGSGLGVMGWLRRRAST